MSFTRELYKLGFEISPVILCDGVAQSIPGGMLPIVALTQSASYVSGLMGGAIELTDLDKYFCHWRAAPGGTMVDYDIGRYPFANQAVAANALLSQPLRIPMLMDAPVFDNDFANHLDKDSRKSASYRSQNPVQIEFTDLVGQPTWIQFGTVSIPCVMRSDIQVGDYIRMPKKLRPMIQASSYSQFRDDSAFTGDFLVSSVRLVGNSRQPDANSWVTVIEAHPTGGIAAT
ncbi:hypothetical protein DLQ11_09155 [Salmonella enterica]|nr:hypothetical protein [Salmonella enterica]